MAKKSNIFTTIRTEGALLPPDLLQRISEGVNIDGLTSESYHRPGEKLNEAINRSWNALQGAWASFKSARERLPETDLGTSITRERWLLPLFRELDYGRLQTATAAEIDGRTYPISHGWDHVPIHLVSYKLELDKRTQGVAGASSASPHSMVQIFLNRSDDNLWGFLSNGYKLRILRDNLTLTRQAYVEFDLEAMMEGEVYSDFVLLWLLCHQSRLEGQRPSDCWLEKWMKVAEDEGTRALDQLRNGVEEAITALGIGFIEHPASAELRDKLTDGRLNGQDYYRQLLRMVYRLLFLFVAEDRDLLLNPQADETTRATYINYYSTQRLRRMAETFKGTAHPDLFESLRLVMRLLSGEQNGAGQALGLVPLGSFLFSDRAVSDVIACKMSNQHLLTAVRALSLTYDQTAQVYRSVDYKNLGPEELGSVYESLLELHPQINVQGRRFALATAGGNERKTTGSYYTPTSLINALLDSALDPVLEEAMKPGKAPTLNPSPSGRGTSKTSHESESPHLRGGDTEGGLTPEQRILALKICDPACGSGHFLIAAANRMAKALAFVRTGEEEPTPSAIQEAKRDIISHCIYGVDINPMAVELCKVNLWMEALEPGKPLNFLDHRIQVGNSLLGTTPKLMADGIPDDAFSAIEGDDRAFVTSMKRVNREERKQRQAKVRQLELFDNMPPPANYGYLTSAMHELDATPDDTLEGVRRKEAQYARLAQDPEYIKARLLADAWCSAFVWEKRQNGLPLPMTDLLYRRMEADPFADNLQTTRETVVALTDRYGFFHWHVAFPDVFTVDSPTQPPSPTLIRSHKARPPHGEGSEERVREIATKAMRDIARNLRQRQTPAEQIMWEALRKNRLGGLNFRRQHPVAKTNYVVDFFCYSQNLIVELDGKIHQFQQKEDAQRQAELESLGYHVLRFANERIYTDLENVLAEILTATQKKVPPHEGEGFRVGAFNEQTGWHGGFDVVLGNPPWERIKIQEKEWFAERAPEIASAPNAAARRRMIAELAQNDPYLLQAFADDKRKAEGESHFVRVSERFPLCGRGDVNTYTIFAETSRHIINGRGRVGIIVPSGIATDDTTKFFFQDLMQTQSLASLYDFENREGIFPAVDSRMKFCLLTLRGTHKVSPPEGGRFRGGANAEFVFFAHTVADLKDDWRRFTLSAQDIAMLNPNTGTMATFRSVKDAEITKAIYRHVPILIKENAEQVSPPEGGRFRGGARGTRGGVENPWGIRFATMFHMSNDSHLFRTREELEAQGFTLEGNRFFSPRPEGEGQGVRVYLPLYEAKMMHQFTHRWATYESQSPHLRGGDTEGGLSTRDMTLAERQNPHALPIPRYWVDAGEVQARLDSWHQDWLLGFRDIARSTDERTAIFDLLPLVAIGNKVPLWLIDNATLNQIPALYANTSAFTFDYVVRQKTGSTSLNFFYVKQFPVIPPHTYTQTLLDFIVPRVLELTYTAWDLQPFAQDVGYDGAPFIWDEERRFLMRCELDALYFHLYQIPRDDVDYIMETFPIVKRKDEARHGEYLTKRIILEMFDQMAQLPTMPVPAPKDEHSTYNVPDVSHWETWLNPPPADSRVAHQR